MTEEDFKKDCGDCRPLGRFHDVGNGTRFAICAAKSAKDVQTWAFHWEETAKCMWDVVISDEAVQHIVKKKPGYRVKYQNLIAKMGALGILEDMKPELEGEHAHRMAQRKPGFHGKVDPWNQMEQHAP